MSYEGGMVEKFDYCDVDIFEIGSIDSWAFRVGLRRGDFSLCVYQDPEIEGLNGLKPLKSSRNAIQFVNLSIKHKFLDVYFVKSGNTNGLDDMEDCYGYLKISDASVEIIKARQAERVRLSAGEFNLGEADVRPLNEGGGDLEDENFDADLDEDDGRIVDEEVQESDEDEDEVLDVEDVIYGKEHDCFDDGDLGAANQPLQQRRLKGWANQSERVRLKMLDLATSLSQQCF
ncbi:hypothetical protein LIER_41785 [Lithospermum erythrorhizon]|uniref:PB1-like domain-containing protein n=1 Tax=Lithospermum erythrorhizon TaxID=34254 RepID=A0AAV3RIC4_LITER